MHRKDRSIVKEQTGMNDYRSGNSLKQKGNEGERRTYF